jgi:hypothetical protein
MKTTKLLNLFLMAGMIVLGGAALADSKDEAAFKATQKEAEQLANTWKKQTSDWLKTPDNIADAAMKKKEITGFNSAATMGLSGRACRDGAQAKSIAGLFEKHFATLHENIEPKVTFRITVHCIKGIVTASLRTETFNLPIQSVAAASSTGPIPGPFGCNSDHLNTPGGKACVDQNSKDLLSSKKFNHVLVCKTAQLQCCVTQDGKNVSNCVAAGKAP